jgi:hypothetical protein
LTEFPEEQFQHFNGLVLLDGHIFGSYLLQLDRLKPKQNLKVDNNEKIELT